MCHYITKSSIALSFKSDLMAVILTTQARTIDIIANKEQKKCWLSVRGTHCKEAPKY